MKNKMEPSYIVLEEFLLSLFGFHTWKVLRKSCFKWLLKHFCTTQYVNFILKTTKLRKKLWEASDSKTSYQIEVKGTTDLSAHDRINQVATKCSNAVLHLLMWRGWRGVSQVFLAQVSTSCKYRHPSLLALKAATLCILVLGCGAGGPAPLGQALASRCAVGLGWPWPPVGRGSPGPLLRSRALTPAVRTCREH